MQPQQVTADGPPPVPGEERLPGHSTLWLCSKFVVTPRVVVIVTLDLC
jgi:hypothetical protein